MTDLGFGYMAILSRDLSRVTSVVAFLQSARGPLRGAIWNVQVGKWASDPDAIAPFLFDDDKEDRGKVVDRAAAAQISQAQLGVELPSEDELRAICEAG